MRSPLAPRMMTVSDSMPSYWFVWYIHTPHSSDRESWLEPMVLACPGLHSIRHTEGRAGPILPQTCTRIKVRFVSFRRWEYGCVTRYERCASGLASGALQKRGWGAHLGTQSEVFCSPVPRQVANDESGWIRACALPGAREEPHARR